jgi:sarcosine oxidase subunit beta
MPCSVTGISLSEHGFIVTSEDGRRFQSEAVVNCAGAWGGRIAAFINDRLPMTPTALSMMVTARMPSFLTPVVGVHGRKLSFKQTDNGTVVIGGAHRAFLDMDREKTTLDFSEMRQSAKTVLEHFPIMRRATIVRCWAGIEGMMSDGLPVIGESPSTPGLFHVCGFSAHGFQLSPMVGRLAASLVLGKPPEISLAPFAPRRFPQHTGRAS